MAAVTILEEPENFVPGFDVVRVTTTGTTSTYLFPRAGSGEIVGVIANNESDDDGVGIGVSGQTITITVGTNGDIVTLMVFYRK